MNESNNIKQEIFGQIDYQKCLWPKSECAEKSINSHSIQNGTILEKLSYNSHVIMAVGKQDLDTGPKIEFKKVSRHKATTFTGLCQKHDSELFLPIDQSSFDSNNPEQKFLIAYRSVLREYHTRVKAMIHSQKVYKKGIKIDKFSSDSIDDATLLSIQPICNAYTFELYKNIYDSICKSNSFANIEHEVIFIQNKDCNLAVSSIISPIDNMKNLADRQNPKFIVFNIFPDNDGISILLSYRNEHQLEVRPYIQNIINKQGDDQLYFLYFVSKLILSECENFVLSPQHFQSFSTEKIKSISNFYYQTTIQSNYDCDDQNLMLF